jgi:hypothetical protein
MNEQNNGGQAFPCDLTCYDQEVRNEMRGMSLRDYFAAKAMQGMIANGENNPSTITQAAYIVADLMLKERMK